MASLPLDLTGLLAIAAGLGWASGIRLYAALFAVGLVGRLEWVALPEGLQVLEHPWVLSAAGLMLLIEFFADKLPLLDSVWDAVSSLIRIPAGAARLAAAETVALARRSSPTEALGRFQATRAAVHVMPPYTASSDTINRATHSVR